MHSVDLKPYFAPHIYNLLKKYIIHFILHSLNINMLISRRKSVPETFFTVSVLLFQVICTVSGKIDESLKFTELETLKASHRTRLEDFKKVAVPLVPHDYMKEDIFLVKFLMYNRFNIDKSLAHLKEAIKWRKDNNIDELLNNPPEDFKQLLNEYPIFNDGFDREGRPICETPWGSWHIRKAALAGKTKQLILHMLVNCPERAVQRVREQQAKGLNVTQWVFIDNMDGFSLAEQGCTSCLPVFVSLAQGIEKYFPHSSYGFWLINTPDQFATIFRLLKPALSTSTRNAMKAFTANKAEWQPFLKEKIDPSEMGKDYGGTRERRP